MSTQRSRLNTSLPAVILIGLLGCTASEVGTVAGPEDVEARAARGGKKGGGNGSDPIIASVVPDSALQGETLDVVIGGDNFEPGSTVSWALAGVPTGAIRTNSVTYVSARKLQANITVAPDAATELYDVEVTTPRGRRGIGSELLAVKLKTVGFTDPVSLIGGAEGDYTGPQQTVRFSESRNVFDLHAQPYVLTIDLAAELAAERAAGRCLEAVFTDDAGLDLDAGPRTLTGELGLRVNKRWIRKNGSFDGSVYTSSGGFVVNFTTTIGGVEYFLTTGSSPGAVSAMTVGEDRFARTGGFLRVNVDGTTGPICQGIVDYEFNRISLP